MTYEDDASTIADFLAKAQLASSDATPDLVLVVYHRDGVQMLAAAPGKRIVIGRQAPATLVLPEPSLSRMHAAFELRDGVLWVEDLDSTNGTQVNGQRVRRRELGLDDRVELGAVTVTVQQREANAAPSRGVASHDRFHAMLCDEVERAEAFGRELAVVMVSAQGAEPHELVALCSESLRNVDRVGLYASSALELLLPEANVEYVRELVAKLRARAAERDIEARCGAAHFPDGARTADELIAAAREMLHSTTRSHPVALAQTRTVEATVSWWPQGSAVVVADPKMLELYATVDRVADSMIPVLIIGDTGTGKELIATAIHQRGRRREKPIRSVNCGAIPDTLIESALFGHERGAFTGAHRQKMGVFEEADGGTVFLDEIGDLALQSQVALLRVLETGRICRVGSSEEIPVDVRIVAATHRDIEKMCHEGTFRWDLLYRLNSMVLRVPPLSERPDDLDPLVASFLDEANRANQRSVRGIDPEVRRMLHTYHWPGNVRELRNVIERAVVLARSDVLTAQCLPERLRVVGTTFGPAATARRRRLPPEATVNATARGGSAGATGASASTSSIGGGDSETPPRGRTRTGTLVEVPQMDLKERVRRFEAGLIRRALLRTGGNQSEAATVLNMPRRTLVHKLGALGIEREIDFNEITSVEVDGGETLDFKLLVGNFERGLIHEALAHSAGNRNAAARALGIDERTLAVKLRKYEL